MRLVSHAWVIKNVLRFSDEEMEELEKQIEDEKSSGKFAKDDEEEF